MYPYSSSCPVRLLIPSRLHNIIIVFMSVSRVHCKRAAQYYCIFSIAPGFCTLNHTVFDIIISLSNSDMYLKSDFLIHKVPRELQHPRAIHGVYFFSNLTKEFISFISKEDIFINLDN
jgi:hypothetical protein